MGIILSVCGYLLSFFATLFLLKAMENCPYKCESYYEVGYAVMGRLSIYFISVCVLMSYSGFLIIYYIIIGDTFASVVK